MEKRARKTRLVERLSLWVTFLLICGALGLGTYLWLGVYKTSPKLSYILLKVNDQPQRILPEEVLALHPEDKVKILKVSTNVPLNVDIRLVAEGLDVNALRYEEMTLSKLLPEGEIFNHYRFRIQVKKGNKPIGYVEWTVRPYVEDWMEKVERTTGHKKKAEILERALRLNPDVWQIRQKLIAEYKSLKKWEKAARLLEKVADNSPDKDTLHELLDLYQASGNTKKVVSVLRRIIKLDPKSLDARRKLARTLEKQGRLSEAIYAYRGLLPHLSKANRVPVYKQLGYLYTKTDRLRKAISTYLQAAETDHNDPNLYYNLAYLYRKTGRQEEANSYLSKAVALDPENTEARLRLANNLMEEGSLKKAKKYVDEVLSKKPHHLEALLLLANIAERQGNEEELKEAYKGILSVKPENETILYNLGALEYKSGNLEESIQHLRKYSELNPKDPDIHLLLFEMYKELEKNSLALEEAKLLVRERPGEIPPYEFIFDQLSAQKKYKQIIPVMEKAVQEHPEHTPFKEFLLVAYLKTGKKKLAVREMEEILKAKPEDVDLWLHLARLLEEQGRLGEAQKAYKKVIELSPGHKEAEEAYLRLRLEDLEGGGEK